MDCQIPQQDSPTFSSHKYALKSALRYEIALCIQTGNIFWTNGSFPAGKYPDITIFRSGLMTYLQPLEWVEADDGYIGEAPEKVRCTKCVIVSDERKQIIFFCMTPA